MLFSLLFQLAAVYSLPPPPGAVPLPIKSFQPTGPILLPPGYRLVKSEINVVREVVGIYGNGNFHSIKSIETLPDGQIFAKIEPKGMPLTLRQPAGLSDRPTLVKPAQANANSFAFERQASKYLDNPLSEAMGKPAAPAVFGNAMPAPKQAEGQRTMPRFKAPTRAPAPMMRGLDPQTLPRQNALPIPETQAGVAAPRGGSSGVLGSEHLSIGQNTQKVGGGVTSAFTPFERNAPSVQADSALHAFNHRVVEVKVVQPRPEAEGEAAAKRQKV